MKFIPPSTCSSMRRKSISSIVSCIEIQFVIYYGCIQFLFVHENGIIMIGFNSHSTWIHLLTFFQRHAWKHLWIMYNDYSHRYELPSGTGCPGNICNIPHCHLHRWICCLVTHKAYWSSLTINYLNWPCFRTQECCQQARNLK